MCRGTWPKQGKQTCLLLIFAVYLCALRIAREACACQRLHVICAKGVLPRVLCCYRTDHVVSDAVPSGKLFLLLVSHYFSFCFCRSSSTHKVQSKCAYSSGGSYAARAFRIFRLGGWASDARAKGNNKQWPRWGWKFISVNSEGETCFAETVSSVSAEPPPCEDTSTTSSDSRERCYRWQRYWIAWQLINRWFVWSFCLTIKRCETAIQCGCFDKLTVQLIACDVKPLCHALT